MRAGLRLAGLAIVAGLAAGCSDAPEKPALPAPSPAEGAAWKEALSHAREGQRAIDAERMDEAEEHLRDAVGVLYRAGVLDDVPRAQARLVGLERIDLRLGPESRLAARMRTLRPAEVRAPDRPTCPLFVSASELATEASGVAGSAVSRPCVEAGLRWLLNELRQSDLALPPGFVDRVADTLTKEQSSYQRAQARGEALVPTIRAALEARNLPPLLHYLALVESGYRPGALSHADAAGLWQFVRPTAREYGLRVDEGQDERLDAARATEAAADYLQDLALELGGESLFLVLAAYNSGAGRVRAALHELHDPFADRSYWRLVERGLLPEETARYVARFLAAALSGELSER